MHLTRQLSYSSSVLLCGTIIVSIFHGASRWRWGSVIASQSEGCGVESRQCLGGTGRSLSVTITELSKAMVCGTLSMGHCT